LGRYNTLFVAFAAIGAVGWFINTVSVPSYLLGISSGMVRWNIVGSTIASALAPLLGIIMGYFYGPIGVITAAMFSVGLGALTVQFLNCQRFALSPLPRLASLREAIIDLLCSIAKLGEAGKALVGRLP